MNEIVIYPDMFAMRNFAMVLLPLAVGKPHVLFVLVDDLGWANVGFNRDPPVPKSVVTPNLDRLAGHWQTGPGFWNGEIDG